MLLLKNVSFVCTLINLFRRLNDTKCTESIVHTCGHHDATDLTGVERTTDWGQEELVEYREAKKHNTVEHKHGSELGSNDLSW